MKFLAMILLASLGQQAKILYQDLAKDLTLSGENISQWEGEARSGGDFSFAAKGKPLSIESKEQGFKITAPTISGVLTPAKKPDAGYVKELHVEGGAVANFDSAAAYQGEVARAERLKAKVPPEPDQFDAVEFKTERFDYKGSRDDGTFTLPGAFTMVDNATGKVKPEKPTDPVKSFEQTMTVTGVSGTIGLNPAAATKKQLKTGTIAGPIDFKVVRTVTTAGIVKKDVTKVTGVADKLEFDLVKAHTITLTGHVKLSGEGELFAGTSEGEVATIFLDENNEPVRIRITGEPTKSTAREKKAGGKI